MSGTATIQSRRVVDLLASLVDRSLVVYDRQSDGSGRYRLLETTRQYALEKLKDSGKEDVLRRRHLAFFQVLAEEADSQLTGPEQIARLDQLETEHDNLRAALEWCRRDRHSERELHLTAALWRFWQVRGHLSEGRERLTAALTPREVSEPTSERARALYGAGALAHAQGDYSQARVFHLESLSIMRAIGDQQGIAGLLNYQGTMAYYQSEYASARDLHEESLAIYRALGDKRGVAETVRRLGSIAHARDDYAMARIFYEESLSIERDLGNWNGIAASLFCLGAVAHAQADFTRARALYEESLSIEREIGDKRGIANLLRRLGRVAQLQGDCASVQALYDESLAICRDIGDKDGIAVSLSDMGSFACEQGDYTYAYACLTECIAVCQVLEDRTRIAWTLHDFANLVAAEAHSHNQSPTSKIKRAVLLWGASEQMREALGEGLPPHLLGGTSTRCGDSAGVAG